MIDFESNNENDNIELIPPRRKFIRVGTIIRSYAPCGYYWADDFSHRTALYKNERDLIYTACHFNEDQHSGDFYSEFDDPMIEEWRLLSALVLPVAFEYGMVVPYPLGCAHRIDGQDDLCNFQISEELIESMRSVFSSGGFQPWISGPCPPRFGGPAYEYRDESSPSELQRRIFCAIDPSDYVLMRGLATLLKSAMLARHEHFFEAAIYSLYISLDASFCLVMRQLQKQGIISPNAYDAAAFIEAAFGEENSGRRYFEEYYEDRIKVLHPESRMGIFPYAPVMHDDFYFLYKGLREVYRFLILSEPPNSPRVQTT